jgi:hypothetical protein
MLIFRSALSRSQSSLIVSELKKWQDSERRQIVAQEEPDALVATEDEQIKQDSISGASRTSSTSVQRSGNWSIPWQRPGFLGSFFYQSHEIAEHVSASDALDKTQGRKLLVSTAYNYATILISLFYSLSNATAVTTVADAKGLGHPCSPSAQRLDNSAQGLGHSS